MKKAFLLIVLVLFVFVIGVKCGERKHTLEQDLYVNGDVIESHYNGQVDVYSLEFAE